jgi:exopolysaccharide biosynthesis WecB/TagA/CpsF family protein
MDIVTASRRDLVDLMRADAARDRSAQRTPRVVADANGHALSLRATDPAYRAAVDAADLVHADGGFLVTLSRLLTDAPIAERSATTDLIHDAAAAAAAHGLTFYLLGATEEVNARCSELLEEAYPGLRVVGRQHGFFDDPAAVIAAIREARPDVVWVGMGKPREQQLAIHLRDEVQAAWIVTCGGCFNYVVGTYRRAPLWMQRANLEWLHRLATRPRELFWRYAVTNPHALYLALVHTRRRARDG